MAFQKEWHELVDKVKPHVVRIETPRYSGTGFFFHRTKTGLIAIATAAHVVDEAQYWEEPLRVHYDKNEPLLLREGDRAILIDRKRDTAAIVLAGKGLPVPEKPIELAPEKSHLKVGTDVGWLGYPAGVAGTELCFFGGRVSAFKSRENLYFVDGVVINGVSGGPAFFHPDFPRIIGVLSAYIPNRTTGETLPGLSVVRDVSHLHELVKDFQSVDEAKKEEKVESEAPPAQPRPSESESKTRK